MIFRRWIVTQGFLYGKSRCGHCWRKPIMRMHWKVSERSDLLIGLMRRREKIVKLCPKFNFIYTIIFCRKF